MAELVTPRVGRSQSSSRGVTVAASQKCKPKHAPFKFLRKDEGRLSYACQLDSPSSGSAAYNNINHGNSSSERHASRSLREAIASDMRKGKSQDPFAEVVVAVPKRAPPPNPNARDESDIPIDSLMAREPNAVEVQQPQQQSRTRHEREVYTEDKEPNGNMVVTAKPRSHPRASEESDRSAELVGRRVTPSHGHNTPKPEGDYDDMEWQQQHQQQQQQQQPLRRWRSHDMMMGNGVSRQSIPCRYVDPADQDNYVRRDQNFFRRSQRHDYRFLREEDNLVEQLEEELRAAKEERGRYHQLKIQLDRERQRFDNYRDVLEREIEEERAELDAVRMSEQQQARKDVKVIEERYKSTLELLRTERDANKKLTHENELLRQQLEGITTRMRETQKLQKAETSRLRREIESLTRRNEELLEMTREQQIAVLESSNKLPSAPVLQIAPGTRPQHPASVASVTSGRRDSEDSYEFPEERPQVGKRVVQHRSAFVEAKERKRLEAEKKERQRAEAEEQERKRLEAEKKERQRVEREQQERKRLEAEKKERQRVEREQQERKRLEAEKKERQRAEAEEQERKRLEAEKKERQQAEEEEQEQKSLESQEGTDGRSQELRSQRRFAGHPVDTPRAQNVKPRGVQAQRRTSIPSSTASAPRKPRRTPTAAELVADDEPAPAEDFPNDSIVSQTALGENPNKREVLYRSGKREIHYANGTRKVILPSGHVVLYFTNGDIKRTFPSGKSTYWYAAAQTTHMQHADGVQVFQFHSSGQIERHLPDGKKEILYPDGIYKVIFADGRDETIFPDKV